MIIPKIIFGIDGKEISHFTKIILKQSINNHHKFSIHIPHSVIERPRAYTMERAQETLGKVVHIKLSDNNNFLGIITNVSYQQELGHVGSQIVISGHSKTILLESGKKLHSCEDYNLKDLVLEVIKTAAGEELQNEINPEFTSKIEYQTQYLESDFRYIQRLAKQYNEWLFYDGEKLFFGKPQMINNPIKLVYNKDLYSLNISVQAKPNQYSGYTYNESIDQLYLVQTNDQIVEGLPKLGRDAFEASRKLYRTSSYEHGEFSTGDDIYFESILKKKQESTAADANYITSTSKNPELKIGTLINITAEQIKDKLDVYKQGLDLNKVHYDSKDIGIYIITEISHKALDSGEYENNFKALPAKIKKLPEPDVPMPAAHEQRGVVVANDDPKGSGRVRVQLLWQKKLNARTPWLYVLTPDAGSSDAVNKNRGWVTIPEVGDHVMVGFKYNDPNRPYIEGSLFNGKTGIGGRVDNHIKSLITRSGCTIQIDDTDNKGSITIKDPSDNSWYMDGNGNITVNAPNDITMKAGKNINIMAGLNMNVNVSNNWSQNVGNEVLFNIMQKMIVQTPIMKQLISEYFHTQAGKALINSENEIKIEAKETELAGSKKLFLHSEETATINSKGKVNVHGEAGNNHSNKATSYETVKPEITAKCIVHFRPKKNWKGEDYGFDWMRTGDSNLINGQAVFGDIDYKNIVAKQYTDNTYTTLVTDINECYGAFKNNPVLYNSLINVYDVHLIPWKLIDDSSGNKVPEQYFCSWLSLYPSLFNEVIDNDMVSLDNKKGQFIKKTIKSPTHFTNTKAILSLIIDIEEEPDVLRFEDNKYFTITPKEIMVKEKGKGKHPMINNITIECLEAFSIDQTIIINTIKKDEDGAEQKLTAGKIKVWANDTPKQKKAKILLIEVKTPEIIPSKGSNSGSAKGQKELFENYLKQALIETDVVTEQVDVSTDTKFQTGGHYVANGQIVSHYANGSYPSGFITLEEHFYNKVKENIKAINPADENKYDDYFKAFYLGEIGGQLKTDGTISCLNGYSSGKNVVLFLTKNNQTAAHEFLHSFNLPHSFTNAEADPDALFTYQYKTTENILDYSHHIPQERYSLWKWQWEKANQSIL